MRSPLERAARWEAEANSGFKPERREACLREANRLFEVALRVDDLHQRAAAVDKEAEEAHDVAVQACLRRTAQYYREIADSEERYA